MKREKNPGEKNKYDVIRHILKDYASRENPITRKEIEDTAKKMGCHIGRNAIENFMDEMLVKDYETEEECDKYLEAWKAEEREIILCKKSQEGRRTKGYWMLESISDSEWMYLLDSVLYSKVMTKKEADNLAKRITLLAGKDFSELTGYRHKMYGQPFSNGNEKTENIGHIESLVLKQVYLIRKAILKRKKIRFTLNVYKYVDKEVKLVLCGKISRICSPLDGFSSCAAASATKRSHNWCISLFALTTRRFAQSGISIAGCPGVPAGGNGASTGERYV